MAELRELTGYHNPQVPWGAEPERTARLMRLPMTMGGTGVLKATQDVAEVACMCAAAGAAVRIQRDWGSRPGCESLLANRRCAASQGVSKFAIYLAGIPLRAPPPLLPIQTNQHCII